VDTYYRLSPAIADQVAQHPALATVVRLLLLPCLMIAQVVVHTPLLAKCGVGVLLALYLAVRVRREVSARIFGMQSTTR
jgi:hypothetical protein